LAMAENETLDIESRQSGRWRRLRRLICDRASDHEVVTAVEENLYRTVRKLRGQMPLKLLLEGLVAGQDVTELIQASESRDYAELLALQAEPGLDTQALLKRFLDAILQRFRDQIAMKAVGSAHYPTFESFYSDWARWAALAQGQIQRIAERLAAHPERAPRMPPRSAVTRDRERRALTKMSLLTS
jgi:hypothetical protein